MNKKFSTLLTAGLLVAGSVFSSAFADKIENYFDGAAVSKADAGYYLLVQNNNNGALGDVAFGIDGFDQETQEANLKVLYTKFEGESFDIKDFIWYVSESTSSLGETTVTFKHYKTSKYLRVLNDGSGFVTDYDSDDAKDANSSNLWSWTNDYKTYKDATAGRFMYVAKAVKAGTDINMYFPNTGATAADIVFGNATTADCSFSLYKVKDFDVSDSKLNELYNTAGFNFALTTDGVEGNVFGSQRVKAIKVENAFDGDDVWTIGGANDSPKVGFPDGTYFTVSTPATDYPSSGTVTEKQNWLLNCTFIAVDPTDCASSDADTRKAGQGFKLTTVSGKDLNLFCSENANYKASYTPQTSGLEVSVWNACFTPNTNLDGDKYSLKLRNIRYQETSSSDAHKDAAVGLKVQNDLNSYSGKVLATAADGNNFIFKFAQTTAVDASEFINAEGPSVYNIQLVASDTYLARLQDASGVFGNGCGYYGVGDVIAEPEIANYQFVVSNVSGKSLTLRNRWDGTSLNVKLYDEGDDVYSINTTSTAKYTVLDINREGNVVYDGDYSNVDINGTKIKLIPAEVETVHGLDVENESIVTMAFARDDEPTSNKMYPVVNARVNGFKNKLTDNVLEAPQWMLVKNDEPEIVTSSYAYLNADDKVAIKNQGDTVFYYTYQLQLVQEGTPVNAYFEYDGYNDAWVVSPASGSNFLIEVKPGGNAIIQDIAATLSGNQITVFNYWQDPKEDIEDELNRKIYYSSILPTSKATDIKTYLIQDAPEISLPIETRYVTLKSELGNYISMNEENDGIVVSHDPLTFCLFATDSAKAVPSFYITTGYDENTRYFLFNPEDSVNYYVGTGKYDKEYQWSETAKKAIFKAGVLNITADTLLTMVKGKATLVADNADRKGVKGGLNRFKFQIVEDPDAELYMIRQLNAGDGNYLATINGKLTWANRVSAMRFEIEETTSPTANEAVEASEVSVIAQNGAIIVKGAAGKVVTVSNILGQTIANQVAASDNVTIAAPAGVAVVTVDGEATKVIVK